MLSNSSSSSGPSGLLGPLAAFRAAFPAAMLDHLASPALRTLLRSLVVLRGDDDARVAALSDLPHLLLYGSDDVVLRASLDALVGGLVGSWERVGSPALPRLVRHADDCAAGFPHWLGNDMLLIDAGELGADQRAAVVAHVQQMSRHECLNQRMRRHLVAFLNTHRMSGTMACALRRIVEDGASRCLFVMCSRSVGQVDAALRSRAACLRAGLAPLQACAGAVAAAAGCAAGHGEGGELEELALQAEGSVTRFLVLLGRRLEAGAAGRGAPPWRCSLRAFMSDVLQQCLAEAQGAAARQRAMTAAEERRVHERITHTVHVLEVTGTKHADALHALLAAACALLAAGDDAAQVELVALAARANHEACRANKHTFVLEATLLDVFDLLAARQPLRGGAAAAPALAAPVSEKAVEKAGDGDALAMLMAAAPAAARPAAAKPRARAPRSTAAAAPKSRASASQSRTEP